MQTTCAERYSGACGHEEEKEAFKLMASEYACVPGMFACATPYCAGAQPVACGIVELEYGNHPDLLVLINRL
eukprot:761999-Pleurochrysis_carterae.AAC.1